MKKHIGSTISLCIGILIIVSGIIKPYHAAILGPVIIFGALAYRSAKKRKFGDASNTMIRLSLERLSIMYSVLLSIISREGFKDFILIDSATKLREGFKDFILTDPVTNLVVPLWVLIAYLYISLRKIRPSERYE